MATLNKQLIKRLTQLSRIDCSEEEQESLLSDLDQILEYMNQLKEIDTEGVNPCYHVLPDMSNVMREDEIGPSLSRELFLENAPSHVGGMIRVPPILKGGDS